MKTRKITHIAIWANDLELLRQFYTKYFGMTCGDKYTNPSKHFQSYFLSFEDDDTRIELMHIPDLVSPPEREKMMGLTHLAISVGDKDTVDSLTMQLQTEGYCVLSHPRTTGDGYYESVVSDPEGNRIEITV